MTANSLLQNLGIEPRSPFLGNVTKKSYEQDCINFLESIGAKEIAVLSEKQRLWLMDIIATYDTRFTKPVKAAI